MAPRSGTEFEQSSTRYGRDEPPPRRGANHNPGGSSNALGIRLQRWVWDRRAGWWDHNGPALTSVIDVILKTAEPKAGTSAIDLGSGTGQLSLPLARRGVSVTAVDVSQEMVQLLRLREAEARPGRVVGMTSAVEHVEFPPGSVDLVVSSYALHHVSDSDKEALIRDAAGWLRPGGRLVVGDMMFGRGATARDRAIISSKVAIFMRRGPAGWWRLAKNVVRFTLRFQERPVSIETWVSYFERAGLTEVAAIPVVAEAAVVVGTKP